MEFLVPGGGELVIGEFAGLAYYEVGGIYRSVAGFTIHRDTRRAGDSRNEIPIGIPSKLAALERREGWRAIDHGDRIRRQAAVPSGIRRGGERAQDHGK